MKAMEIQHSGKTLATLIAVLFLTASAQGYVDLAPTLAKLLRDSPNVALVEVEKLSRENNAVIFKKVRDLKGSAPADPIKHQVAAPGSAMPRTILEWAEPGRRAVLFMTPLTTLACIGQTWYQVTTPTEGWWKPGASRPELPLAYCGTVSRLVAALDQMIAGKDAVITTLAHGADDLGASFDIALNRTSLPGLVKIQRTRANPRMPGWVISVQAKPHYMIGPGPVGVDDVPELIRRLSSNDSEERAEAAEDLRWLGALETTSPKAGAPVALLDAAKPLEQLLDDANPRVRTSAAGALLRISPSKARARAVLSDALDSPDPIHRRHGARVCALSGAAVKSLVPRLCAMLGDTDELARFAALQAIATLGSDAAEARRAVEKLLDDPALTIAAADALGRMGAGARPSMKRLGELIQSDLPAVKWAAVRAMSQIGGPDSGPAVEFMIQQLKSFSEVDGYNMMVYLCLLGPDAKAATASIEGVRVKNRALRLAALWSIDEKRFPWLDGDRVMSFFRDADWQRFIFDALYHETGDRFRPAARTLAQKVMEGTAGDIPSWGYKLLAHFPEDVVPTLAGGLGDDDLTRRQRATVALGYMGSAGRAAEARVVAAIEKAANEREQKLLKWCLKQIRSGRET